jgi:hypothetical protein
MRARNDQLTIPEPLSIERELWSLRAVAALSRQWQWHATAARQGAGACLKAVAGGRLADWQPAIDCPIEARKLPEAADQELSRMDPCSMRRDSPASPEPTKKDSWSSTGGRCNMQADPTVASPPRPGHRFRATLRKRRPHFCTRSWEERAPGVPLIMRQAIVYEDVPR